MKAAYILTLSLFACSGAALDVGQDGLPSIGTGGTGGTGGSSMSGAPIPDWTDVGACPTTGVDAPQFVGTWEGAVEDFDFQPVVPLRLVITQATSEGVCGKISWGTTTPPPLPLTHPEQSGAAYGFGGATGAPVPGLTYTIYDGAARDSTLRFEVPAFEHWQGFCEMQTNPLYNPRLDRYSCTEPYTQMTFEREDDGGLGDTCVIHTSHGAVELPLKQCNCESVCECNAEGCAAIIEYPITFDLTLGRSASDEEILVSAQNPLVVQSIRLTRVP